jgi:exopolysaccharide biosynthesis polyprenyl glycosylphosphotransferase
VRWIVLFVILTLVLMGVRGHYQRRFQRSLLDDLGRILASTLAGMVVISWRELLGPDREAAAVTAHLWAWTSACLIAGQVGVTAAYGRTVRRGEGAVNTLIVGTSPAGCLVARRLIDAPEIGLRPIGFLDTTGEGQCGFGLPVLGPSSDLEAQVAAHDVGHVVLTFSSDPHPVLLNLLRRCRQLGLEVSLVPRLFEEMTARVQVERLGGTALLVVPPVPVRSWQLWLKHVLDRIGAGLLLVATAPLMLLIALAVHLESPGPVVYRQRRVGLDGGEFEMLKFRTMVGTPEAEGEADAAWIAGLLGTEDPAPAPDRRTRLGRLLRRSSLDELPQLWNVLWGDMSIVGPRPERVSVARSLEEVVARYGDRHRVRCGITGWAQVHDLRGTTSLVDRTEWDNYYIENWSLWLDAKILLLTLPAMVRGRCGE